MMRSMYSAVSGLKTHQTRMDVIGNNIANVNTVAFKSSSVTFSDILYQTTSNASGANATTGTGGVNAKQIGLGTTAAATKVSITSAGASETTGNPFDIRLTDKNSTNFFIVNNGSENVFTRSGSFYVDGSGNLCMSSTGYTVMGWQVDDTTGDIRKDTVSALRIMQEKNLTSAPEATTEASIAGVLDENDTDVKSDSGKVMNLNFYDNLGYQYTAKFAIKATGADGKYTVELTSILDSDNKNIIDGWSQADISSLFGTVDTNAVVGNYKFADGFKMSTKTTTQPTTADFEATGIKAGYKWDNGQLQTDPAGEELVYDAASKKFKNNTTQALVDIGDVYDLGADAAEINANNTNCTVTDGKLSVTYDKTVTSNIIIAVTDKDGEVEITDNGDGTFTGTGTVTGDTYTYKLTDVYDGLSATIQGYIENNKQDDKGNPYNYAIDMTTGEVAVTTTKASHMLEFDTATGKFDSIGNEPKSVTLNLNTLTNGFNTNGNFSNINVDFTQCLNYNNSGKSTIGADAGATDGTTGKGRKLGAMTGISIDTSGRIYGTYDNGNTELLGQIAVAQFSNASGLEKVGESCYRTTLNSGEFDGIGVEISADGSSMTTGELEMSNVDLSTEFTSMITTQRGFQANSRVITTSDTLLEELVNLKR